MNELNIHGEYRKQVIKIVNEFKSLKILNHICSNSYFYNNLFSYNDNYVSLKNTLKLLKRIVKYLNKVNIWKYSFKNISFFLNVNFLRRLKRLKS